MCDARDANEDVSLSPSISATLLASPIFQWRAMQISADQQFGWHVVCKQHAACHWLCSPHSQLDASAISRSHSNGPASSQPASRVEARKLSRQNVNFTQQSRRASSYSRAASCQVRANYGQKLGKLISDPAESEMSSKWFKVRFSQLI